MKELRCECAVKIKMPPARVRWVRGRNEVAAWVIPVATHGMGTGILTLVSNVDGLLNIVRVLL